MEDMRNFATYDIETVPSQDLPEECRPKFDEESVKLGNLKDRFKIAAKIDEERAIWESKLDKTMSLDPDLCQVCAFVGIPSDGGQSLGLIASNQAEEHDLLVYAWAWIKGMCKQGIPVVSFNGKSFDLPVLRRRAMFSDVSVHPGMYDSLTRRFSMDYHVDLMEALAHRNVFSGKPEFHSLDYYLKRFGIGNKFAGLTGADVYPMFKEGKITDILAYCRDDVDKTAELFRRVGPWITAPKQIRKEKAQ
jgi:hypothetical protein